MKFKSSVMDEQQVRRSLIRMSHEIIEKNKDGENIVLVGIRSRGFALANELAQILEAIDGRVIEIGIIDADKKIELPFRTDSSNVVLVNDVLFTGRTITQSIDILTKKANPKTIQLAVLIDRDSRELPISADYKGKSVLTTENEIVTVSVQSVDGETKVDIYSLD